MKCCGCTHTGKVRKDNQDAYFAQVFIAETGFETALCVVCDGMGGAKAGNIASELAVDTFRQIVRAGLDKGEKKKTLIRKAVFLANEIVYGRAEQSEDYRGMGTTLVAAIADETETVIANIGDSRCYHIRENGITQVTKDHSLVEDMIDRGEILREDAKRHPNKNYITRALGTETSTRCDLFGVDLQEGEYLLLCTDGLSNLINPQEMLFELIYGGDSEGAAERLLEIALSRGAPDNVTVVVLAK